MKSNRVKEENYFIMVINEKLSNRVKEENYSLNTHYYGVHFIFWYIYIQRFTKIHIITNNESTKHSEAP